MVHVAYIFTEQRYNCLKLIRNPSKKSFEYNSFTYNNRPDRVYLKRFMGFKLFTWSQYIQGNPDPVEFDVQTGQMKVSQDASINEISEMMYYIMKSKILRLGALCAMAGLFVSILVMYYVYQNSKDMMELYNLVHQLKVLIQNQNLPPVKP